MGPLCKSALKKAASSDILNLGAGFIVSNQERITHPRDQLDLLNYAQCSRCLRRGHSNKSYQFPIQCLNCYNYGHRASKCLKAKARIWWQPKRQPRPKLVWKPKIPLQWEPISGQETRLLEKSPLPPREMQQPGASTSQSPSPIQVPPPTPAIRKTPVPTQRSFKSHHLHQVLWRPTLPATPLHSSHLEPT